MHICVVNVSMYVCLFIYVCINSHIYTYIQIHIHNDSKRTKKNRQNSSCFLQINSLPNKVLSFQSCLFCKYLYLDFYKIYCYCYIFFVYILIYTSRYSWEQIFNRWNINQNWLLLHSKECFYIVYRIENRACITKNDSSLPPFLYIHPLYFYLNILLLMPFFSTEWNSPSNISYWFLLDYWI